jgi:hypothetical protein
MELKDFLLRKYSEVEPSNEGFTIAIDKLIDYAIGVYVDRKDEVLLLNERKEAVILELGIKHEKDMELLRFNKSRYLSRIVTDILHITANREFELYVSALEAATILLDVVRRPIDDTLEDEKWLNALKAKKQGFNDAKELLDSAKEISEQMLGAKETDLEDHVSDNIFKKGHMEELAGKYRDKK